MSDAALNRSEREELERLRARTGRRGSGARWTGAVVLLVFAALLGVLATVTVFARNELLDTDRFVANVEPLYGDAEVRAAVAARVSGALTDALDVDALVAEAIAAVQTKGAPDLLTRLGSPLASGINSFIDKQVHTVVYSDQFTELWRGATREAHTALVGLLTGEQGGTLQIRGQDLVLDLGPVMDAAKQRLVDNGFGLAARVPAVAVSFTIASSAAFPKMQLAAALIDTLSWLLPIVALALLAAGIALAPSRRRGLLIGAVCTAAGMLLLWAAISFGRAAYLAGLGDSVQSPTAARNVYDTLTRFLVDGAQTIALLALIVALACWLVGPGVAARAVRRLATGGRDVVARTLSGAGLSFGPFGAFVHRYRRAIEFLAVIAGLLWIVLWRHPGVSGLLQITAVVLLVVLIVEVIGRSALEARRSAAA